MKRTIINNKTFELLAIFIMLTMSVQAIPVEKTDKGFITANISNDNIIISPSIFVKSPNGGENWTRGTTHTIKWNHTGDIGSNVKLELFKGSKLSRTISSSTSNDGSYSWHIPLSQVSDNNYKVKITSKSNSLYTDISDNNFTIRNPSITVVSPNGGENWTRGTTHTIKWNHIGNIGSNVKIELFRRNKLSSTISSSTSNDGSYSWHIPSSQLLDSNYTIKVTSNSHSSYTDISDNSFTIRNPSITVISPNGGEDWATEQTSIIKWNRTGNTGSYVKIELFRGSTLELIISSSTPNNGSYIWHIPYETGLFKIKITSKSNPLYTDASDDDFRITSSGN